MTRRRPVVLALLGALLAGLVGAGPATAADKTLRGTLLGSDGRAVSALLGFDLRDEQGRSLGASGCVRSASCPVEGYAVTRRVNFDLGPEGSRDLDRWATDWSVALPEEADRVYVDVYPQGRRYAGTDTSRYGASFRRNLPVPYSGRVNLRLPVVCDPEGGGTGTTGYVNGYARDADGDRVPLQRITAFSMEADDNGPSPVLGTGVGTVERNGYYRVDALASGVEEGARPGQRYQLIATAADGRVRRVYGVRVTACRGVPVDIRF